MTSTPGHEPGSSDSPEPDHGDSPADDKANAETTAGADVMDNGAASSERGSEDAAPGMADRPTGERPQGAHTGWAQQQPPPAHGWAQWTPPHTAQAPATPHQPHFPTQQQPHPDRGGPRWGPALGGQQGAPWASLAAAPKPGVVPLRPLGVGEILDGAIATLRLHWRAIMGVTIAVGVVTQACNVVVQHQFVDRTRLDDLQHNPSPSPGDVLHAITGTMAASGLSVLVAMIGTIVATAMLTVIVSRAVLGRPVTARDAWRDARPRLPRLLGLTLLIPVLLCGVLAVAALPGALIAQAGAHAGGATLVTLGLLGGFVLSLWLWVQWSLASPALMLEKQGIVAAMKRSAKLVRGSGFRVLGVTLLAFVLAAIVSSLIQLPFVLIGGAVTGDGASTFFSADNSASWSYLAIAAIGGVIASAVTLPVSAGVIALLYMDQRIRRESLDIELARAARSN